jgi:hypothetical protein
VSHGIQLAGTAYRSQGVVILLEGHAQPALAIVDVRAPRIQLASSPELPLGALPVELAYEAEQARDAAGFSQRVVDGKSRAR